MLRHDRRASQQKPAWACHGVRPDPLKEGRAIPTCMPTPTGVFLKAPGKEEQEGGDSDDDTNGNERAN
eukprot:121347-Pyramimonas_sp.AAC.1